MKQKSLWKVTGGKFYRRVPEKRNPIVYKKGDTFEAFPEEIPSGFRDLIQEVSRFEMGPKEEVTNPVQVKAELEKSETEKQETIPTPRPTRKPKET